MIEGAEIFLQMAEHAHSEPQLVTQWLALSMRNYGYRFIQADMEKYPSDPERNKQWLELLSQQKTWYDEVLIALIRYERKECLKHLSKTKNLTAVP
jgi:hypothetical protein